MFNRIVRLATVWLLLLPFVASGQDEFADWLKQQDKDFDSFVEEKDREFGSFLKKRWKPFQVLVGENRDEKPKPKTLPKIEQPREPAPEPEPLDVPEKPIAVDPPKFAPPAPAPQPKPVPAKPKTPTAKPEKRRDLSLRYYGEALRFSVPVGLNRLRFGSTIDNKSIARMWERIAAVEYQTLLNALIEEKSSLKLNGWGFGNLVTATAEALYPERGLRNERVMFIWFMMTKAGYQTRAGYAGNRLLLMLSADRIIYETTYITFEDQKFFIIDFNNSTGSVSEIRTYPGNYPGANRPLDIVVSDLPGFPTDNRKRALDFTFRGKAHQVRVPVNKNLIDFLDTYPQSSFDVYFNAPMQSRSSQVLVNYAKAAVQDLSEAERINFLLRLTQRSFPYATDDEQFGKENYLFPDETLYYEKSDCEDRVSFFTFLVRNVLGKKIVGLHYENHVAVAVELKRPVKGDGFKFKGRYYQVADPTYFGADIGMTMPQFKNASPTIIEL